MAARQTANTVRATRPRRTTPISDIEKFFLQFCTSWRTASTEGKKRDKARDIIKEWFEKGGDGDHEITVNDQGSQLVEFEDAVVIDGVRITGLENVRRQSDDLDLDKVDAWLDSLPEVERAKLAKKLYKPVTDYVFQQDALYALNQAGVLSDAVLDSLFTTDITWALTVKKD
jgi:hypothetical protein